MSLETRIRIRDYIGGRLRAKGRATSLMDSEPLFSSGRLDSLDAVETVVFLEQEFGIDFSETGFDPALVDSVDAITAVVDTLGRQPGPTGP